MVTFRIIIRYRYVATYVLCSLNGISGPFLCQPRLKINDVRTSILFRVFFLLFFYMENLSSDLNIDDPFVCFIGLNNILHTKISRELRVENEEFHDFENE